MLKTGLIQTIYLPGTHLTDLSVSWISKTGGDFLLLRALWLGWIIIGSVDNKSFKTEITSSHKEHLS